MVAGVLVAAACGGGGGDADPPVTTAAADERPSTPPSTSGLPPELVEFADEWPTAGQDLANRRTAAASTITAANVADLEVRHQVELPTLGGLTTVPLVLGDTIYLQGGSGAMAAVDRSTGEVRWVSEPTGLSVGPFGVAVADGRVHGMDGSEGVLTLDTGDGGRVWAADITATETTGVGIQPVVADGLVLASSVPVSIDGIYTPGDRGVVSAIDATTGEVRWTFDTVRGDLWGHPEVNSGGGAWYTPAVDLERRLVYVGVANPAPFPGTPEWPNATSRPGPNLYTNSLVALDLDTGELAWFHQVVPHDLFDRDQVHALVAEGAGGDVVISAGKSGIVVGLDPDDGTVLWETEVGRHENDDLPALDGPTVVAPGTYGGVLTPPSTADGVVYLASVDAPTELRPDETAYFGAPLGTNPGEVTAVDATTGEVLWAVQVPGDPLGGTTVVNDLVLTAMLDGTILALDRSDGSTVWSFEAEGGINGWMAAVGDELVVPVGNAAPPQLLVLGLS